MKDETAWMEWYKSYEKPVGQKEGTYVNFAHFISEISDQRAGRALKILDIGCGRGELMNYIHANNPHCELIGIDVTKELWKSQKEQESNFVCGDALILPFKDDSFDVIVFYDVLYHLVGQNRCSSVSNVANFFENIVRICKSDSYILFKEQSTLHKVHSQIIFWITKMSSILGMSLPVISIHEGIVVSFLTHHEIDHILSETSQKSIFKEKERDRNPGFVFRTLLPMMRYIALCRVIKKGGDSVNAKS